MVAPPLIFIVFLSSFFFVCVCVSGLCGVVKSSATNDHSLGSVCALFFPGFNRDAYDVSHLTIKVAIV